MDDYLVRHQKEVDKGSEELCGALWVKAHSVPLARDTREAGSDTMSWMMLTCLPHTAGGF